MAHPDGNEGYGSWCAAFSFKMPVLGDRLFALSYYACSVRKSGREFAWAVTYTSLFRGAWPSAIMSGLGTTLEFSVWRRSQLNRMSALPGGRFFVTGSHDFRRENFKLRVAPILIRTGSWIAIGSLILPGVTIGRGAVVSAGSAVLKDVPANCLVRGNPATVVCEIVRGLG